MQNSKDWNENYATERGGVSSKFRVFGLRVVEFVENSLGGAYFLGKFASVLKKECYSCRFWRIMHYGLWLWVKEHLDYATKPEPDATQFNLERGKKMSWRTFILNSAVLVILIGSGLFPGDAIAGNVILYDRDGEICAADIGGSNERQLTSGSQADYMPSISPDGTTIAFSRDYDLYLMNQDGGDQRLLVSKGDVGGNNVHDSDWTIDGEWIYFNGVSGCCSGGLYKVRPEGSGLVQVKSGFIGSGFSIRRTFGDKVIFNQRRSGSSYSQNVRITNLDGVNEEQVTGGGPSEGSATFGPCWSPNGQRFAYNYGHQHIYVADYPVPYNPVEVKTFDSEKGHMLEWLDDDTVIWIDARDEGPMHALNVDTLEDTDLGIEGNNPYVGGHTIPVTPIWWDESWSYRRPLTITNNVEAVLYDYSMKISLNTAHLIAQGKMQGDCGDIRIVENGQEIN